VTRENNLVSIIIPVYNTEKYIKETILSVINQSYQDWELIIIDDGSTDGSAEIIQAIDDKRVKYYYQQNASQAVARNRGIKLAKGEFIAFLDADDLWEPSKLERQLGLFDNGKVGLTYTNCSTIDSSSSIQEADCETNFYKGNVYETIISGNIVSNSSVIVRSEILSSNELWFRERRKGVEDWDLWIRIAKVTEFDYIQDSLLKYRVHPDNTSSDEVLMKNSQLQTIKDLMNSIRCDASCSKKRKRYLSSIVKNGRCMYLLKTGHQLLSKNKWKAARKMFLSCISYCPFSARSYWGLIRTFSPFRRFVVDTELAQEAIHLDF